MPRLALRTLLVLPLAGLVGCSYEGTPGIALSGRVTYQGRPVVDGMIYFMPTPSTSSRSSGTRVTDGRYAIKTSQGPQPGEFIVQIVNDPGGPGPNAASKIPAKYNTDSTLKLTIPDRKSLEYDFDLK